MAHKFVVRVVGEEGHVSNEVLVQVERDCFAQGFAHVWIAQESRVAVLLLVDPHVLVVRVDLAPQLHRQVVVTHLALDSLNSIAEGPACGGKLGDDQRSVAEEEAYEYESDEDGGHIEQTHSVPP